MREGTRGPVVAAAAALLLLMSGCAASSSGGAAPGPTTSGTSPSGTAAAPPDAAGAHGTGTVPGRALAGGVPVTTALLPTPDPADGPGDIDWAVCEPGRVSLCGTVAVPVDHADPTGATLNLAVELVPATDRAARRGVLWTNPGGPGMPGVGGFGGIALTVPASVREHFDVASFDPRGIGASRPLDCGPPTAPTADRSPDDDDEITAVLTAARAKAEACAAHDAALLPHLGTQDVARDLDVLRRAVGDEELDFIGMSYGTVIGQQYLALFPEEAGRIVLDGVVDPAVTAEQRWTEMAQGRELAFARFLDWCGSTSDCAFDVGDDPLATFATLSAELDRAPIELPDGLPAIDQAELEGELAQALYGGEASWDDIAWALHLYQRRDVSCLADLACRLRLDLQDDPGYAAATFDGALDPDFSEHYADGVANDSFPFDAVACLDWPIPRDPVAFAAMAARITAAAPTFGRALSWAQAPCVFWGAEPVGLLAPTGGTTTLPPLVLSTTHDPATPLLHARSVATRLGAPLLTVDSARHVIFPSGTACLDDVVAAYLVDGTVPRGTSGAAGAPTTCPMPAPPTTGGDR